MVTRVQTCTERLGSGPDPCGGQIRPSYIGPAPIVGASAQKGDITYPASCQTCGKVYPDIVSLAMTPEDLAMVGARMSPSSREELEATATKLRSGGYEVALTEDRARDFAAKAANLGLVAIADKIRQELNALTSQRRQR
jgi:hypothetical protein